MRRPLIAFLAALSLWAAAPASPAAAAPLPVTPVPTFRIPQDVVSVGRYVFFSQYNSDIGRVAPDGSITYFDSGFFAVRRMIVGPDGNLWFIGATNLIAEKQLGRMTPDGTLLSKTAAMSGIPTALTVGADGNVWVAETGFVAQYAPNGFLTKQHDLSVAGAESQAYDITAGPDGNVWTTVHTIHRNHPVAVLRITPAGVITRFFVGLGPTCPPNAGTDSCAQADRITPGPDGALWFTVSIDGNKAAYGRITTSGSALYEEMPAGSQLTAITLAPDYGLYVLDGLRKVVTHINAFTGETSDTPLPADTLATFTDRGGMILGADGDLWIAGNHDYNLQRVRPENRPTTGNLLVNASGSQPLLATSASATVPMAGWATSPNFTATGAGALAGTGGAMWGGPRNARSYARQLVDVSGQADAIDGGARWATLSGWIGGVGSERDHGTLTARFSAADGTILGEVHTAPVTEADRGYTSGYIGRAAIGKIPAGTRFIEVEALAETVDGNTNDAYFDDLSLITGPQPPAAPGTGGSGDQGGTGGTGGGNTNGGGTNGTGGTGTGGNGNGDPGTGAGGSVAVASAVTLASNTLIPLATGGPTTTDSKSGLALSMTLSAASKVTIRFDRSTVGRKRGKLCVAKSKAKHGARSCKYYVTRGTTIVDQPAGTSTIRLTGCAAGKPLPTGSYRVVITPAGGASTTVALKILRSARK